MLEIFEKKKRSKLELIKKRLEICKMKGRDGSELMKKRNEILKSSQTSCFNDQILPSKYRPRCRINLQTTTTIGCNIPCDVDDGKKTTNNTNYTNIKLPSASTQMACLEAVTRTTKVSSQQPKKILNVEERKAQREEELGMYSQGWKKDSWGKWIKDREVEFDTDEEED